MISKISNLVVKKKKSLAGGAKDALRRTSKSFQTDGEFSEEEVMKSREVGSEYDLKNYTLGHVVAVITTQALTRGIRTRKIMNRWRAVTRNAKVTSKIHPTLRTRHMLADNNFDQLKKGVESIKLRMKFGKLASNARKRILKPSTTEDRVEGVQKEEEKEEKGAKDEEKGAKDEEGEKVKGDRPEQEAKESE